MTRSILLTSAAMAAALALPSAAFAQIADQSTPSQSGPSAVETVTVTAKKLDAARNGIQTQTGASTYTITSADIEAQPGGDNSLLNQVVLQAPGVAQDSFGQLHVRGEHNGLQYRLNGVILPEGISVFGQTLDPRLADSVKLITGALPAEYGLRTAGIIDVSTKSGAFDNGGQVSIYGASHNTIEPSFDYGGSSGNFNYFVSGDFNANSLGIESPDGSGSPVHDRTTQYHGFAYLEDILDSHSRLSAILGTSHDDFDIPNSRGLHPAGIDGIIGLGPTGVLQANGQSDDLSNTLDERQREITHYAILSYLRTQGNFDFQVSGFARYSSLNFTPDGVGDLLFDGVAQQAFKKDMSYGTQAEGAYHWGDAHTIRAGVILQSDRATSRTSSLALPTAPGSRANPNPAAGCADPANICQTSDVPLAIADDGARTQWTYSAYIQDEWKLLSKLTLNYGVRYDSYKGFDSEHQISPRANLVWEATDSTTVHAGYSRYFSPPPFELVGSETVTKFLNTTAAPAGTVNDISKAERAD